MASLMVITRWSEGGHEGGAVNAERRLQLGGEEEGERLPGGAHGVVRERGGREMASGLVAWAEPAGLVDGPSKRRGGRMDAGRCCCWPKGGATGAGQDEAE